jgi:predicted DNA-binding transcriptional regulator YafY
VTLLEIWFVCRGGHASSEKIGRLLAINGRGHAIVFRYTKPNGESEIRHVTIEGVSGESIRALDHKDNAFKNFRIDRISDARNA